MGYSSQISRRRYRPNAGNSRCPLNDLLMKKRHTAGEKGLLEERGFHRPPHGAAQGPLQEDDERSK